MLLPPSCLKCVSALDFQIPPQEDDYGFDLEEKNKAVVVKSVQRGSLAEVRPVAGTPYSCGQYPAGRVSMSLEVGQLSRFWDAG